MQKPVVARVARRLRALHARRRDAAGTLGRKRVHQERDRGPDVYMDAGTMKGNYSARAILKLAPPQGRKAFKGWFGLYFDF
jgi:hypothetical protein